MIMNNKYKTSKKIDSIQECENKIPEGLYCYTIFEREIFDNVSFIKPYPYFKHIQKKDYNIGFCELLNKEIDDQCKECGINIKLDNVED